MSTPKQSKGFLRLIIILLLICVIIPIVSNFKENTDRNMMITGLERRGGIYYVYAIDENDKEKEYIIEDSLMLFKWNSKKIYYDLKVGQMYDISYHTMHIPFANREPNIANAKRVYKSIN